ncbi:MAG TPA: chromosome segregation protein SMC [Pirellulales bacterium]|nr:chromosome segregation protein SMC [Pirellulales bacterium]
MLKALELVGFKSFADKTRFEFPRGITAIVGPNGSGKSNVVDGIKWVLGEQSVKSLRGKEMADCIFNGSASRAPVNTAETTLVFDNSSRLLAIDSPEVSITRRVYRSGEGEYLINGHASRLRDIRDLFTGTGVATEAYSVIEQGKVDGILQSSPRERRIIFEEAAGISRFKAKKVESLRRLERVEQNLLRLADIVGEVESRLKSVRQQASKARRYQEHATRLQDLRIQVALADWRTMSERLAATEAELHQLAGRRATLQAEIDASESQSRTADLASADIDAKLREHQIRLSAQREQIAAHEAAVEHSRLRSREIDDECSRLRKQLVTLGARAGDLSQQVHETSEASAAAESLYAAMQAQIADDERVLHDLGNQLVALRGESESSRSLAIERMRQAAALERDTGAVEARLQDLRTAASRHEARLAELLQSRDQAIAAIEALQRQRDALEQVMGEGQRRLSQATARSVALRQQLSGIVADLNQLEQRSSRIGERADVLAELERTFEGLGTGVREVLTRAQAAEAPFKRVRGVVADLFRVAAESAALVEIALGERTSHIVIESSVDLQRWLDSDDARLAGRATFIPLDLDFQAPIGGGDLSNEQGVVCRADLLVETDADLNAVCQRLLGSVWIVESLEVAHELARGKGRGQTFVTTDGEALWPDGAWSLGPRESGTGLMSRRSELRALKAQMVELSDEIAALRRQRSTIEEQIAGEDRQIATLTEERAQATAVSGEHRVQMTALQSRIEQLDTQQQIVQRDHADDQRQLTASTADVEALRLRLHEARNRAEEAELVAGRTAGQVTELAEHRLEIERRIAMARMELAKSDERLQSLRTRRSQVEQDRQERQRTLSDLREQLETSLARQRLVDRSILQAEGQLASLYLLLQQLGRDSAQLVREREAHRACRESQGARAQSMRSELQTLDAQHHAQDLVASEVRLQRKALADRLREDYQIELAEHSAELSDEELHQRDAVENEIAELRRKLNQLGNVNLDSLRELEELEARFSTLKAQHDDLDKAKQLLVQIIDRINVDSRRLFSETFEKVRGNFQTLFRKLFGGGQADILLEQGVDILDSGIEIIARPPGKEPRNISLLSGGEKTLTCVALLLAVFQYRPSPFCVLDEVDAALDEANIERFVGVLQEFLAWTQFIVVTHSKKTMTGATTLYGVTMQESGVSKRVSVRFDDVSDDGQIRPIGSSTTPAADETQAA